jgi:hypothetical protein
MSLFRLLFLLFLYILPLFEAHAYSLILDKKHCSWWTIHVDDGGDPTESITAGSVTSYYDTGVNFPGIQFQDPFDCRDHTFSLGINGDCYAGFGALNEDGYSGNSAAGTRICGKIIKGAVLSDGTKSRDIACLYSDVSYANGNPGIPDNNPSFNPFFAPDALYPILVPDPNPANPSGYIFTFLKSDGATLPNWNEVTFNYITSNIEVVPDAMYTDNISLLRDIQNITAVPSTVGNRSSYSIPSNSKAYLPYKCEDMFGSAKCNNNFSSSSPLSPLYIFDGVSSSAMSSIQASFQQAGTINASTVYVDTRYVPGLPSAPKGKAIPGDTAGTRYPQVPVLVTGKCAASNPFQLTLSDGTVGCYACVMLPPGPNPPPMCDPMLIQKSIPELVELCANGDYIQSNQYNQASFIGSTSLKQCDAPIVGQETISPYNYGKQGVRIVFDNVTPTNFNSNTLYYSTSSDSLNGANASVSKGGVRTGPSSDGSGYRKLYTNSGLVSLSTPANNTMSYFAGTNNISGYDNANYVDVVLDFSGYGSGAGNANPTISTVLSYSNNNFVKSSCNSGSTGACQFTVQDPDNNQRTFSVAYELDQTDPFFTPTNKSICLSEITPNQQAGDNNQITCINRPTPGKPFVQSCLSGTNCSATNPGIQWAFENDFSAQNTNIATITLNDVINNIAYDNSCTNNESGTAFANVPTNSTYPYVYDLSYSAYFLDTNLVNVSVADVKYGPPNTPTVPDISNLSEASNINEAGCLISYTNNLNYDPSTTCTGEVPTNSTLLGSTSFTPVNTVQLPNQSYPLNMTSFSSTNLYNSSINSSNSDTLVCSIQSGAAVNSGSSSADSGYNPTYDNTYFYKKNSINNLAFMCLSGANITEYVTAYMLDKKTGSRIQATDVSSCQNGEISQNINDVVLETGVSYSKYASYNSNIPIQVNGVSANQVGFVGITGGYCVGSRLKTDLEAGLCVELMYNCPAIDSGSSVADNFASWTSTASGSTAKGTCTFQDPSNANSGTSKQPSRSCVHGNWEPVSYTAGSNIQQEFCPWAAPCSGQALTSQGITCADTTAGYSASCSCNYDSSVAPFSVACSITEGSGGYTSSWVVPQNTNCPLPSSCPATLGDASDGFAICPETTEGSSATCTCNGSKTTVTRTCNPPSQSSSGSSDNSNASSWGDSQPSCPAASCAAITGNDTNYPGMSCNSTTPGASQTCTCNNGYAAATDNSLSPPGPATITRSCNSDLTWGTPSASCNVICYMGISSFNEGLNPNSSFICNDTYAGGTNSVPWPNTINNCGCGSAGIAASYTPSLYKFLMRECNTDGTWGNIKVTLTEDITGNDGKFYPAGSFVPSGDVCNPKN